jgi:hypothetical protein
VLIISGKKNARTRLSGDLIKECKERTIDTWVKFQTFDSTEYPFLKNKYAISADGNNVILIMACISSLKE